MRVVIPVPNEGNKEVVLEHGKEKLRFSAGGWGEIKNPHLVFNDINAYWKDLPQNRQDSIWELYKELDVLFSTINHLDRLHAQVRLAVSKLMALHPFEEMKYFIERKSQVKYPRDLHDNYCAGSPEGPLTYLRGEYVDLIALLLQLRIMIPIWGEYINRSKSELGTHHKDSQAGLLLAQSHVPNTPPFLRLRAYIEAYLGDVPPSLAANFSGISSANFPNWAMNVILVKRLVVTDLVTVAMPDEATNVMSKAYNATRALLEQPDRFHRGVIYNKSGAGADTGNEEDNTSIIEGIKVREPISEGEIVALEHFVEQTEKLARSIDVTVPTKIIADCSSYMYSDNYFMAHEFRFWLAQWVLCGFRLQRTEGGLVRNRVISPKALAVMRHESQMSAIIAAQALLWHWGFPDLAYLLTAKPEKIPSSTMVGSTISKLDKGLSERLVDLYPMPRILKGKRGARVEAWPNNQPELLRAQNALHCVAIKEIGQFVKLVGPLAWDSSAPRGLCEVIKFQNKANYRTVPSDIKNQLAKLVLSSKIPEAFQEFIG